MGFFKSKPTGPFAFTFFAMAMVGFLDWSQPPSSNLVFTGVGTSSSSESKIRPIGLVGAMESLFSGLLFSFSSLKANAANDLLFVFVPELLILSLKFIYPGGF